MIADYVAASLQIIQRTDLILQGLPLYECKLALNRQLYSFSASTLFWKIYYMREKMQISK